MEYLPELAGLVVCLAGSFLYAGAETGFYTLSREQAELDARRGSRGARIVRRLLRDDAGLLVTLLIGNNLMIELATHFGDGLAEGLRLSAGWSALVVTLTLTPIVFLLGEALPKDLFHRRPQSLTYGVAGAVLLSRLLFWPLERLLRLISLGLERALGIGERPALPRPRERLVRLLDEGQRQGVLPARARILAENALALRRTPISRCMTPWEQVLSLPESGEDSLLRTTLRESRWTRLPVVSSSGAFVGYVHQLEVLAAGEGRPVLAQMHDLPVYDRDMPVDRALLSLRGAGKRAAVVGTRQEPVGLVTLKDLVEEISGDLAGI